MLVDTSGFFSLYDEADAYHEQAVSIYDAAAKRLTTGYVLAEYTALAHVRGVPRREIIKFSNRILDDTNVEIIWVDENLHRKAVALLRERADKTYSLCDAVSFVVMRERGISESLTTDKHFRQEGFVRLLEI
ncbi:MAG: type II toxin-antitoxin system VapC family toxin [Acidobacteria bacterium]|jgi:predicted nucleic acid-binding protein|nr:type II toxin-antitoxin system VapC family toxin [Acidobacteriota bacterium]MBA4183568.1 type II toxin-antitoxin system VapC family toxin [Acidobacteriota bacterium]